MAITASLVKELRELTGAGMMDCKKALTNTDGDMEKAVVFLREKGLAQATARAGRIATEGLVLSYITDDQKSGAIVEVNSETDFVAKNQEFRSFVEQLAKQAAATESVNVDELLNEKWSADPSVTVNEALSQKVSVIGENLRIRRFVRINKTENGSLSTYIHGEGKIAVIVKLLCEKDSPELVEVGKNLAMQIAAMNPKFIASENVDEEFIAQEREILKQQALNEGKPENVVEKMVEGRLKKELKDFCLLEQEYIKDSDLSIKKYLENMSKELGGDIKVAEFIRFATGEGLEKKQENFAEEVSNFLK